MTLAGGDDAVRGVVLDVEGTTTPMSFVYDVLFPYARARLRDFFRVRAGDAVVQDAIARLATEWTVDLAADGSVPPWPDAPAWAACERESSPARSGVATSPARTTHADIVAMSDYVEWLMDRDQKSTGLKIVQGEIWRGGFESGALLGEVYPDVKPALERWRAAGRIVAIYSSGSATAQRLLFGHSTAGDLTPLIDRHFDTTVGPKRSAESYTAIARALNLPPAALLFVSDVDAELVAARAAGLDTRLCVRSGDAPPSTSPVIRSFDEL